MTPGRTGADGDAWADGEGDDEDVLRAPPSVAEPDPVRFPVVQAAAPVVAAAALFALTGSRGVLALAVLGPVLAVATLVDGRLRARHRLRRERARYEAAFERLERAALRRHRTALARARAAEPSLDRILAGERVVPAGGGAGRVALVPGTAARPSGIRIDGPGDDERLATLRRRVARLDGLPVAVTCRVLALVGPSDAVLDRARALVIRLVAGARDDQRLTITGGRAASRLRTELERAGLLADGVVRTADGRRSGAPDDGPELVLAPSRRLVPARAEAVVEAGRDGVDDVHAAGRPVVRVVAARVSADRLTAWAAGLPSRAVTPTVLTDDVAELFARERTADGAARGGPVALLGLGPSGPVELDLVADGPHVAVGGTSGSGKSELLRTIAVSLAARHPPDRLRFLGVDFKGGATFDGLARLPHCAGVVTDLDVGQAPRLVTSLTAELRRREAVLRAAGVARCDDLAEPLDRLVVLVDEFQALVAEHPEVQASFADLAARGRSLGLHLVLGAQRPVGAMRDALLANLQARVCLRVTDAADALLLVGSGAPAGFGAHGPGRALARTAAGAVELDVVRADASLVERVVRASPPASAHAAAPWCPPLPAVLGPDDERLAGVPRAIGLVDDPARGRVDPLVVEAGRAGGLLVLGGPGSGKTAACRAAGEAARRSRVRVVEAGGDAERAWDAVARASAAAGRLVLLVDDLDLSADRLGDAHAIAWVDRVARIARERDDVTVVATAQRVTPAVARVAPLLPRTLRLELPSRHEYALSGGDPRHHRSGLPPGRGRLGELEAQLVHSAGRPRPSRRPPPPPLVTAPPDGSPLAVVSERPDRWTAWLADAGRSAGPPEPLTPRRPAAGAGGEALGPGVPGTLVGDPAEWRAAFGALAGAARTGSVVLDGRSACTSAAACGVRVEAPPVADPERVVLVRDADGALHRRRVPWTA